MKAPFSLKLYLFNCITSSQYYFDYWTALSTLIQFIYELANRSLYWMIRLRVTGWINCHVRFLMTALYIHTQTSKTSLILTNLKAILWSSSTTSAPRIMNTKISKKVSHNQLFITKRHKLYFITVSRQVTHWKLACTVVLKISVVHVWAKILCLDFDTASDKHTYFCLCVLYCKI